MTPPPVTIVAEPIECPLPELPVAAKPIGMATPNGIVVTRSDLEDVAREIQGLRDWIVSAAICIAPSKAGQ